MVGRKLCLISPFGDEMFYEFKILRKKSIYYITLIMNYYL